MTGRAWALSNGAEAGAFTGTTLVNVARTVRVDPVRRYPSLTTGSDVDTIDRKAAVGGARPYR